MAQPAIKKDAGHLEVVARSAPDLDRLIHERVRLGILSALASNATMTFSELKALLDDGPPAQTRWDEDEWQW